MASARRHKTLTMLRGRSRRRTARRAQAPPRSVGAAAAVARTARAREQGGVTPPRRAAVRLARQAWQGGPEGRLGRAKWGRAVRACVRACRACVPCVRACVRACARARLPRRRQQQQQPRVQLRRRDGAHGAERQQQQQRRQQRLLVDVPADLGGNKARATHEVA